MNTFSRKQISKKKAMSTFEVIGYAILALVVILVCIVIFVRLTKAPGSSISGISDSTTGSVKSCREDPANCDPLAKLGLPVVDVQRQQMSENDLYTNGEF